MEPVQERTQLQESLLEEAVQTSQGDLEEAAIEEEHPEALIELLLQEITIDGMCGVY